MRPILLTLGMALPLAAAYTYFLTADFQAGIPAGVWQPNGTVSGAAPNGLVSAAANGGSAIYTGGIPDGTAEYEVKATLKITASGGTFVLYMRATSDALTGPAPQGSYYAMEMTPTLTAGGCTMAGSHYKRVGGTVTLIASHSFACANGMTVRLAQRNGFYMGLTSLGELIFIGDSSLTTGKPGFGARALPAGNGVLKGEIGPRDLTAPTAFDPQQVRSAVFDNRVDLAWQGVADDANGSGIALYQIYRNGSWYSNFKTENWTDTAVSPSTNYSYEIRAIDTNHNVSLTTVAVTTPAAGNKDARKTGVRPLGTYWGASPENIDLQSGNVSFSLPTVTAKGRGGTAVPLRLSYNSQNWRKDPGGTWKLGTDVGFGWGWKMLAGSLTPVYSDWWTIHHFVYMDATGAEYELADYELDVNGNRIWQSRAGIFVKYDAAKGRLYFPGGTFWEFDCTANGTEADAGTMYPTRLVDTNGNEIKLRYQGGLHYGGVNGSARVTAVEDVRAVSQTAGGYRTYQFHYNADAIPHLTSITSEIGDGAHFGLSYSSGHSLYDPFTQGSFGTAYRLNTMTLGTGLQFAMEYHAGSHELKKVTMPYGGTLQWLYAPRTLAGARTQMEVYSRVLNAADGAGDKAYAIYHDNAGDMSLPAHGYTVVVDASLTADKAYFFYTGADYRLGLFSSLYERRAVGGGSVENLRSTTATWAQTSTGNNPYISASEEVINPGLAGVEKASKMEQTIDIHGNMTERRQYGYYTPGGAAPLARTFTYSYLTHPNYTSRYMWNRLEWVKVQKPGGSPITLVTNFYDIAYLWGSVVGLSGARQHDTAAYGTSLIYRGNVARVISAGKTLNLTYDMTGNLLETADTFGHSARQIMDGGRNYAVPMTVIGGTLQTALSWNSYHAPLSATGPNGDLSLSVYDGYARPDTQTAANGSVTDFRYSTAFPHWALATTGTRWTKTWLDGFGRGMKVESGYNTGSTAVTVSVAETKHAPCACTPVGKLWKTSLPYAPGTAAGDVRWTEYLYDALGRTVQVRQPVISGTTPAGITNYSYSGIVVTVTDPAGKWKSYENDALGNLVKVTEPQPGGGANYESLYTYSELGQLLTMSMTRPGVGVSNPANVTQTRTWVYDANRRLQSVAHPESGTTSYHYNADGSLLRKTDAKGQKVEFAYDSDGRVTAARRYLTGGSEDVCARVDSYYGSQSFDGSFTQYAAGRLAATATGCQNIGAGQLIEMYSYTLAGAVTKKRLRMVRGGVAVDTDVSYGYGPDGKLATVLYPGAMVPYTYTYDLMDRPVKMTGPSGLAPGETIDHAKSVVYGVAGQVTSMQYLQFQDSNGDGTPYYFMESKSFNALYQMTRQTTAGTGGTAADIEYYFSGTANNGRITGRKNYVSGENVVYSYDELNRLVSASISGSGGWGQSFTHDGFGNLWSQTVTKGTAPSVSLSVAMATNRINASGWGYDANGNTTLMPALGGGTSTQAYDADNRLLSWQGPAGMEEYGYLADNKRVWKKTPGGAETVYFYGAGGQKLVTYVVQTEPFRLAQQLVNVYFGGKLIRSDGVAVVHDRLGSVVARIECFHCSSVAKKDYFAYGDEIGGSTAGNVDKFGTYHRDQTTGLDYADQRYFAGLSGRFLSSDPYEASGGAASPASWNRFSYTRADPVNRHDPSGLADFEVTGWGNTSVGGAGGGGPLDPAYMLTLDDSYERTGVAEDQRAGVFSFDPNAFSRARAFMPAVLARATSALKENKECLELFGTEESRRNGFDPIAVLQTLYGDPGMAFPSASPVGGTRVASAFVYSPFVGGADATTSNEVVIDFTNGLPSFSIGVRVNINVNEWNGTAVAGHANIAASVLLHEMGHVYDLLRGSGGSQINDDSWWNTAASVANNVLVNEKCKLIF